MFQQSFARGTHDDVFNAAQAGAGEPLNWTQGAGFVLIALGAVFVFQGQA